MIVKEGLFEDHELPEILGIQALEDLIGRMDMIVREGLLEDHALPEILAIQDLSRIWWLDRKSGHDR